MKPFTDTKSDRMRFRLLGAILAGGLWLVASPATAAADGPKVFAGDYARSGSAWYKDGIHSTGHVYLCDHAEDGHSVKVYLVYRNVANRDLSIARWNTGGPYRYNGCKDVKAAVRDGTKIFYKVCLGDYNRRGKRPHIKSSCSGWTTGKA